MPTFTDFFTKFSWPDFWVLLAITLIIVGVHEGKNVWRLFAGDSKKETKN